MSNKEVILEENPNEASSDFSEADKARLIVKIDNLRDNLELKKKELEKAIKEGQSTDIIEVLTIEAQHKSSVLQNLEEDLAAIRE